MSEEAPQVPQKFVHLHNHSSYSMLDGLSSVKEMVQHAKDLGYQSLALTDHGTCAGLCVFNQECKSKGIKPILGMEAYITKDHTIKEKDAKSNHLLLLAKNKVGYHNLIKLSSFGYIHGFYRKPRIDFDMLSKHHDGLIVSSACSHGEIPELIWHGKEAEATELTNKYKELLGEDFYLEVMIHEYNEANKQQQEKERQLANKIYKLGKSTNVKVICTQDMHYIKNTDWEVHDILLSVQTLNHIKNPDRLTFGSKDFYMKSIEEMSQLYAKAPEFLMNTVEIAEKVEKSVMPDSKDLLPPFKVPDGFASEEDYLKHLIVEGMKKRGLINKKIYRDRIKYEMDVIIKCNYTRYFLILWDIINFTKTVGLRTGPGRGSAVGSLVLYVMEVTQLDPIKYNLLFERFLNPERISPPDVDVDFDYDRRNEVYEYIVGKYGADHCSQIGTYNSFKARAAIKSTAKAMDIGNDWEEYLLIKDKNPDSKVEEGKKTLAIADEISKTIPFEANITIEEALKHKKGDKFQRFAQKYPKLVQCARRVEKTISSAGVHPAGIIFCKDPIVDHIPVRVSNEVTCSQYTGPEVEKFGLLKFDLLALKNVTILDKTIKLIKSRNQNTQDKNLDDINAISLDDKEVFRIFNEGRTLGIFQFESDGMTKLLKNIRVDSFEDLIAANALYRPGPMQAGVHDMYCAMKHKLKQSEAVDPRMEEILKETYGLMIYQEGTMKVAQVLGGFTLGQADVLRKAIGKKDKDLMAKLKENFVSGCIKNNMTKEAANKLFEQIEFFGGYGFNKSHSGAYSQLAYQIAYFKRYYPIEFMCNLLTNEINNNDHNEKLNLYIADATKMGIICKKIDLNKSGIEFRIEKGISKDGKEYEFLRSPFTMMKGVGEKAVVSIVQNQPYNNLTDFIKKVDNRLVNSRVFKALVESGCMTEAFKIPPNILMEQYEEIKKNIAKENKKKAKEAEQEIEMSDKVLDLSSWLEE